jgi:hypothetical protein
MQERKLDAERPELAAEVLESKSKKHEHLRTGISISLKKLSRSAKVEKVFGNELCDRLAELAKYDARKGVLDQHEKKNIDAIAALINETVNEHLETEIEFFSEYEFKKALISGDPAGFVTSIAESLSKWKSSLPIELIRAIEREQLKIDHQIPEGDDGQYGTSQQALTEEESAGAAGAFVGGVGAIIGLLELGSLLGEWLSGPSLERHRYAMTGGLIINTETYLRIPWRGFEIGNNNQHFTAQYKVEVEGGVLDELKVIFEMRFEGGGFDRLVYPIEAIAWDQEQGIYEPQLDPVGNLTRYHQKHECELQNTNFLVIAVGDGVVHYGGDGIMTGAGLIPQATLVNMGYSYPLPPGESIWQYGVSF